MRIPITLHTAQKKANDIAFLDCGATECFISQRFINQHKLGVHLMENPRGLQNADGSPNTGGGLKYYTELEVITGEAPHLLCFYIADMGPDDLILGYPWFAATNACPVLRLFLPVPLHVPITNRLLQTPFVFPVSPAMSLALFTITLPFIVTCRRGSSSSLSRTLTHYAYPLISATLYDTRTRCGRPFPGLSCI